MAERRGGIDWTTVVAACLLSFVLGLGVGVLVPPIHDCHTSGANALCPSED